MLTLWLIKKYWRNLKPPCNGMHLEKIYEWFNNNSDLVTDGCSYSTVSTVKMWLWFAEAIGILYPCFRNNLRGGFFLLNHKITKIVSWSMSGFAIGILYPCFRNNLYEWIILWTIILLNHKNTFWTRFLIHVWLLAWSVAERASSDTSAPCHGDHND